MEKEQDKMRAIPAIDRLLMIAANQTDLAALPHGLVVQALRQATQLFRDKLRQAPESEVSAEKIIDQARTILLQVTQPNMQTVINGTGIVLHTNLGRAPLSPRAQARVGAIMAGYSNLEYDISSGQRGRRYSHVASRICLLTGAEAAIVVNNNAAAVLLVLSGLACGREVLVSRGQLVEIGGSFRIPDVLKQSGATLVEVGTTNRTNIADYERAIGPATAAILKVHTSNYRIIGFVAQAQDAELAELAHKYDLPLVEDLGSGTLLPLNTGEWTEPTVGDQLAAGADIITFSGDKLFGGAQAGIIAGKKQYIEQLEKHPLLRAVRIDKLSLAAIEGTLFDYIVGRPEEDVPVQRMLRLSPEKLSSQAEKLAASLQSLGQLYEIAVIPIQSQAGGGALPAVGLDSFGVSIKPRQISTAALERQLREKPQPLIARVQDDRLIIDVRCLSSDDLAKISEILAAIAVEARP